MTIDNKNQSQITENNNNNFINLIANISQAIYLPSEGIYKQAIILHIIEDNSEKKNTLNIIASSSLQLMDYTRNLSDLAKSYLSLTSNNTKQFDIKHLINNVITKAKPAAECKDVRLVEGFGFELRDEPGVIIADYYKIQGLLEQLVNNAIKFTEKGHVAVTTHLFPEEYGKKAKEAILQFIVHDTGVGFSLEEQQKIQEYFSSSDCPIFFLCQSNIGLGFILAKQFLKELNGNIEVSSEEGKRATFTCQIPVKLPEA